MFLELERERRRGSSPFSHELLTMYMKYAEKMPNGKPNHGASTSDLGGLKEVFFGHLVKGCI